MISRNDIIRKVARETNSRQADVALIVYAYEDEIIQNLLSGEDVLLYEFLKFKVQKYGGKIYYNPYTGEKTVTNPKVKVRAIVSDVVQRDVSNALSKPTIEEHDDEL